MASQSRRHPWAAVLAGLALIAIIAGLIAAGRAELVKLGAGGVRGVLGVPLAINTTAIYELHCPSAPDYAASGSRLFILAVQGECEPPEAAGFGTHVVAIYNSQNGRLQRLLYPDTLLDRDAAFHSLAPDARFVSYYSLGWAPDDRHIALVYTAFTSAARQAPGTLLDAGLLVIDVSGGASQVIHGDSGYFSSLGGPTAGLPLWNLARAMASPSFTPETGLAYAWAKKTQPYPILRVRGSVTELPTSAGPRYPVGDPTSGSTFTIWQPGLLVAPGSSGTERSAFITTFPSWSPRGDMATVMTIGVNLSQPSDLANMSDASGLVPMQMSGARITAPPRDHALSAVQEQIGLNGWAMVAWNPDGTLLASIDCFAQDGQSVEIRDTQTGEVVGSAPIPLPKGDRGCADLGTRASSGSYPGGAYTLGWSSDGARLLFSDRIANTLTQWPVSHPAQ